MVFRHNFFGASDCKFVFQVDSRNEWLGLDDGEWLGNVISPNTTTLSATRTRIRPFMLVTTWTPTGRAGPTAHGITGLPAQLPSSG